jgi:hypothetical protein
MAETASLHPDECVLPAYIAKKLAALAGASEIRSGGELVPLEYGANRVEVGDVVWLFGGPCAPALREWEYPIIGGLPYPDFLAITREVARDA